MKKLFYVLAQKGKIKVNVSRHVSIKLAYAKGDVFMQIDNHCQFQDAILRDGFGVSNKKFNLKIDAETERNNRVFQGLLDIPAFREFIDFEYEKALSFVRESREAKSNFEYFVQWDEFLTDGDKAGVEKVIELLDAETRVKLNDDEYLVLADCTDRSASPFSELHLQLVRKTHGSDGVKVDYPDICAIELLHHIAGCLKENGPEYDAYLDKLKFEKERIEFNKARAYIAMIDKFLKDKGMGDDGASAENQNEYIF